MEEQKGTEVEKVVGLSGALSRMVLYVYPFEQAPSRLLVPGGRVAHCRGWA